MVNVYFAFYFMTICSVEDNLCELKVQSSKHDLVSWPDNTTQVYLELDLESLTRDIDLFDLHILLEHDSSGDEEDEDLDLERPFPTVIQTEVEETFIPSEQVRRIVDLQDYTVYP